MKFSLKTLLITLGAVGALIGVMGRLMLDRPEAFLATLRVSATFVPFLLAIATILWIGVTGWPASAKLICASCQQELGPAHVRPGVVCPACRADLGGLNSVSFVRNRRGRRGLILWGLSLVLVPMALLIVAQWLAPTGSALELLNNRRLIDVRLAKQFDEPWVWRELLGRLKKGNLSSAEADRAVEILTTAIRLNDPAGRKTPLSWQREFISEVLSRQMLSEDVYFRLCDAFFGLQPVARPIPPQLEGMPLDIELHHGNVWSQHSGLDVVLEWDVTNVLLDGSPVQVQNPRHISDLWHAIYNGHIAAGDHLIKMEVDCAYVDPAQLATLRQSKLPISQWTAARKRWTKTISIPFTVKTAADFNNPP